MKSLPSSRTLRSMHLHLLLYLIQVNSQALQCLSQCHVLHCIRMPCVLLLTVVNPHKLKVGSSFSGSVLFKLAESLGRRKTVLALRGKSHAALSITLFNGSIAIPTPSRMRSLFPYCYCTISYLCGCPVDVNAYSLCQQSELNSTQGGESEGGRRKTSKEITK